MRFHFAPKSRRQGKSGTQNRRANPWRRTLPVLELLEARRVLAVFTVNTTADSVDVHPGDGVAADANGLTSLRAAVMEAEAEAGPTTIIMPAGTYHLTIAGAGNTSAASGDLDLFGTMTIQGAGAGATVIDAHGLGDRVFDVLAYNNPSITLADLTVTGGTAPGPSNTLEDYGGGLRVGDYTNVTINNCVFRDDQAPDANSTQTLVYGLGGAISSSGNLHISNSIFEQNYASNSGGAMYLYGDSAVNVTIQGSTFDGNSAIQGGGAIQSDANLTIDQSTFSNNIAKSPSGNSGQGGALEIGWNLNLTNSTISGNQAVFGGAMYNFNNYTVQSSTITIQSSTIADNTGLYEAGGILQTSGQADKIENSIIGPNSAKNDPDVIGTFTSLGHNIIANTTGGTGFGTTGDQLNVDPELGPLANNGGPTQTQALLVGSPAIDAANPATAPATDQRGVARPYGNGPDIGAYEYNPSIANPPVANNDAYSVTENATLSVSAVGVLANDTAVNSTPLTAALVSGPNHGTLTLTADGSFVYAPTAGYYGPDSFTYDALEGDLTSNVATVTITVNPGLIVTSNPSSVPENAGSNAATGTVIRSGDLSQSLTVSLASSDTTVATVPSTVTIAAAQSSATFPIGAVDDTILTGTRAATITASASGNVSGSTTLDVTDYETLSLSLAASSVPENAGADATTGTVTRNNTNLGQSLIVTLASSNTKQATVPATVTIPSGLSSVSFPVNAVDDLVVNGTQKVQISASASGYVGPATSTLSVTDTDGGHIRPQDIIVSTMNANATQASISEYTTSGLRIQQFPVPYDNSFTYPAGEEARDLITDETGHVELYNGTFTPYLATLDPTTGSFTQQSILGWSTVNNASFGGIATFHQYVYLTDMATGNGGGAQGIVRVNINDQTWQRFATDKQFQDLTMGWNGLLYALDGSGLPATQVSVYNPVTMALVRTFTLPYDDDYRGIAVNATGDVFAVGWNGGIYHFDGSGNLLASVASGFNNLEDIDLRLDGTIVVGDRFGDVILADTSLARSSLTRFSVGSQNTFVAFAAPTDFPLPTIDTTPAALAYTENDPATAIDPGLLVTTDGEPLTGATVQIGSGFQANQDVLGFSNQNGIRGSYDAASGALSLSGSASAAQYQAALESVTYANTSDNPDTTPRSISFSLTDGTNTVAASKSISITAVDDPPVITTGQSFDIAGGAAPGTVVGSVAATDVDSPSSALQNYSIVSGNSNNAFAINAATGQVTVNDGTQLNWETPSFSLGVTVSDGQKTSAVGTVVITVLNAAVSAGGPYTIQEGAPLALSATAVDPDGDTLAYSWDVNGDGVFGDAAGASPTMTWAQLEALTPPINDASSTWQVSLRVTDGHGATETSAPTTLSISDVLPTATLSNSGPVNEGQAATVSFANAFSPSPVDTGAGFHYDFSLNESSLTTSYATAGTDNSAPFTFNEQGTYTVWGRILASDGASTDYSTTITVNDLAPTATLSNNGPVNEGQAATVSFASPFSPSQTDTSAGFHYDFSQSESSLTTSYATAGTATSAPFTFNEQGTYTVWGRILASDSAWTDYSTTITVNDVAPTATLSNSGPVNEGQAATVSFANAFSPSPVDTGAGFHYAFSLNESSLTTSYSTAGTASSAPFTFNAQGTHTVWGRILASDDVWTDYSTAITVNEALPTASVSGPAISVPGQTQTFTFSATDPEPVGQTFTYVINWGDGSAKQTVNAATSPIQKTHVFTAAGSYTVAVTATDGDGGTSAPASLAVPVRAAALEGRNLFVGGTAGNDTIFVAPSDLQGDLKVTVNGGSFGPFHPTGDLVVFAQAGDDHVQLESASIQGQTAYVAVRAVIFGESGNNTLDARGSTANNVLVGGPGNDTLYGGRGRNLLIGGGGSDTLYGGSADDILIAGTTNFDFNRTALDAIMNEWGRTDLGYQARINDLTGATSGGLNGSYLLNTSTVHDDGTVDSLYGSGGQDWFFYHPRSDVLKDKRGNEIATSI